MFLIVYNVKRFDCSSSPLEDQGAAGADAAAIKGGSAAEGVGFCWARASEGIKSLVGGFALVLTRGCFLGRRVIAFIRGCGARGRAAIF